MPAANNPAILELEPGTYLWCTCGKSKEMPLCDRAHIGTDMKPIAFTVEKKEKKPYCQCTKTGKAPFCDGTHRKL